MQFSLDIVIGKLIYIFYAIFVDISMYLAFALQTRVGQRKTSLIVFASLRQCEYALMGGHIGATW